MIIYIVFGLNILALLYTLGAFFYTLNHAGDLSRVTTTELMVLPEKTESAVGRTYDSVDGTVRYRLNNLYGEFSYLNMPRRLIVTAYIRPIILSLLLFVVMVQLANVFEDLNNGKPFIRENARRLRIIGLAMIGGWLFNIIHHLGCILIFKEEILIKGWDLPWLFLARVEIQPGLAFGGLVVIVISEVFRLGNMLQQEQELTI